MREPNFLYIGPDKAGSTWIHQVLSWHPEVFVTPAKDLYFFDKAYGRGIPWYLRHFDGASNEHKVVAEISHDYLFSSDACNRIAKDLPGVRLMVCLREPVDRAFSAYLYLLKHDLFRGSFEEAIDQVPEIVDNGLYGTHLEPYLKTFGRNRVYVGDFSGLEQDSNGFAQAMFKYLGVSPIDLPDDLRGKSLSAARARSPRLAKLVKRGALVARDLGLVSLVGHVKSSALVQRALYSEYSEEDKPAPAPGTIRVLRSRYVEDVRRLDNLLGSDFQHHWGYR